MDGNKAALFAATVEALAQLGWLNDAQRAELSPWRAQVLSNVAGLSSDHLTLGIDGCSAPNYAMPLSRLARCYARLARPEAAGPYGESLQTLSNAMTAHPELGSGTGRNDADFMRAGQGDWVTKVGADGVQVVGSRSRGQGLAIKIMDGNKAALFAATVEAMDQLGWLNEAQRAELSPWRAQVLRNVAGLAVGERRAIFRLTRGDPAAH